MKNAIKAVLKNLREFARLILNALVRLTLSVVYFVLLFPFGILIRACSDFLNIKKETPSWQPRAEIDNLEEFLTRQ